MRKSKLVAAVLLLVIPLLLTGCWKKPGETTAPVNQQQVGELPQIQLPTIKPEDPTTYPPENFISLNDRANQNNGDAYRSYENNRFVFKVAVTLPDAPSGQQYQAWLINSINNKFIPAGVLQKTKDRWTVNYSSDRDAKEFAHVVITVGKNIADPAKATIVASGDFR